MQIDIRNYGNLPRGLDANQILLEGRMVFA